MNKILNRILGVVILAGLLITVAYGIHSMRLLNERKKLAAAFTLGVDHGAMGAPYLSVEYKVDSIIYRTAIPASNHPNIEVYGGLYLLAYDSVQASESRYLFSDIRLPDTINLGDDLSDKYNVSVPVW